MKTGRLFLCLSTLQFSLCLEPFVQIQDMTEFLQDAQVREGTLDDVRRVLHLRTGICYSYSNTCLMGTAPDRARLAKKFGEEGLPSACIGCRACESVCPQKIEISAVLSDFTAKLNNKEE